MEEAKSGRNLIWSKYFTNLDVPEIEEATPPKINIEPENDGLEDDLTFPGVYSQVPC